MARPGTYVDEVPGKGRGVFTSKPIKAGAVIERAYVIVMSHEDRLLIDQTRLYNYIFEWQPDGQELCCMALGRVPLYNHAYNSNCEYYMEYEKEEMYIQAIRDIAAGEELTINYNGTWDDETQVWFEAQ